MAKRRVLVFVFAACVLAAPSILVSAFPIGDWQLSPYPVFWGAGIAVEYGGIRFFEGVDTIFMMGFDGAYENLAYFRYPDGTRYDPPREPASLSKGFGAYDDVRFNWHVGVRQGLLYDAESSKNLLPMSPAAYPTKGPMAFSKPCKSGPSNVPNATHTAPKANFAPPLNLSLPIQVCALSTSS